MVDGHLLLLQDMVTKTDKKRKGFIRLLGCSLSLRDTNKGVQGRNLETGVTSRDHGRSSMLTGLLLGSCSATFLIQSWPTYVKMAYGPLCSPASISKSRKYPTDMTTGQSGGSSTFEVPPSQACQVDNQD